MADEKTDSRPPGASPQEEREELVAAASIAAHQLKSPLASVQSVLELLGGGFVGPLNARQRELVERAVRSLGRGMSLVSDLLALRELEDVSEKNWIPVNLTDVVRSVTSARRDAAAEAGLEFEAPLDAVAPGRTWTRGERDLITELFEVPLDNALKYTPQGGRVEVSLDRIDEDPDAGGGEGRTWVRFVVEDTGIGIPGDAWNHLFEEFYRAPNARKTSREGTGLGLAFAQRAAHLLGGRIQIEPAPTGGTRAVIDLPVHDPEPRELADAGLGPSPFHGAQPPRYSRRVVVVGGVTAGPKAAARIVRNDPDAHVTVVERGRFLGYAGCGLPYYIAGVIRDPRDLYRNTLGEERDSPFFHHLENIRTLELTEAVEILRDRQQVRVRRTVDGEESLLPYDQLVLATGSRAAVPPMENTHLEGLYTLHGVEDAEAIRERLRTTAAREVVIVGAGLMGCEVTESIARRGCRITLLEARSSILDLVDPELAVLVSRHLESQGIKVHTESRVMGFEGTESVQAVLTEQGERFPCDFVILATGVQPEVSLAAAAGLSIGSTGAIEVDAHLRTRSDPNIWAVGDCAENKNRITGRPALMPMGSTALKQGRVAADNICGQERQYPGMVASMVLRAFDYTVARAGLNEREARDEGMDPVTALVPAPDRAGYLPSAHRILLKLVVDRASGRLVGAQGVGRGDVAKRMDVLATALSEGIPLDRLAQIDLPYAPPYALAIDSVLTAVNVLRNKLEGRFVGMAPQALRDALESDSPPVLVDVRTPREYGRERLAGCRHIPMGALRGRMHEIPRDVSLVLVCESGVRSYEASLTLRHHGFEDVRILDGGISAWPYDLERL